MTWQKYKSNLRNSLLLEDFFSIMEQFDALLAQTIDSTLGLVALWGKGILYLRRFCYAQGICTIKEFWSFYK